RRGGEDEPEPDRGTQEDGLGELGAGDGRLGHGHDEGDGADARRGGTFEDGETDRLAAEALVRKGDLVLARGRDGQFLVAGDEAAGRTIDAIEDAILRRR